MVSALRSRGETSIIALVEPGHLDGFQNLLAGFVRIVGEAGELADPAVQVGEADGERIHVGKLFVEGDGDLAGVCPLHEASGAVETAMGWPAARASGAAAGSAQASVTASRRASASAAMARSADQVGTPK